MSEGENTLAGFTAAPAETFDNQAVVVGSVGSLRVAGIAARVFENGLGADASVAVADARAGIGLVVDVVVEKVAEESDDAVVDWRFGSLRTRAMGFCVLEQRQRADALRR